jgi:hypothetical protein
MYYKIKINLRRGISAEALQDTKRCIIFLTYSRVWILPYVQPLDLTSMSK